MIFTSVLLSVTVGSHEERDQCSVMTIFTRMIHNSWKNLNLRSKECFKGVIEIRINNCFGVFCFGFVSFATLSTTMVLTGC